MKANLRPGFWIMALLLCCLNMPLMAARAASDSNAPAESACKEEVRTGSRIPVLVCPGDAPAVQSLSMSEQIIHPTDLGYVLSTGFPGLSVQTGTTGGGNLRQ